MAWCIGPFSYDVTTRASFPDSSVSFDLLTVGSCRVWLVKTVSQHIASACVCNCALLNPSVCALAHTHTHFHPLGMFHGLHLATHLQNFDTYLSNSFYSDRKPRTLKFLTEMFWRSSSMNRHTMMQLHTRRCNREHTEPSSIWKFIFTYSLLCLRVEAVISGYLCYCKLTVMF